MYEIQLVEPWPCPREVSSRFEENDATELAAVEPEPVTIDPDQMRTVTVEHPRETFAPLWPACEIEEYDRYADALENLVRFGGVEP